MQIYGRWNWSLAESYSTRKLGLPSAFTSQAEAPRVLALHPSLDLSRVSAAEK